MLSVMKRLPKTCIAAFANKAGGGGGGHWAHSRTALSSITYIASLSSIEHGNGGRDFKRSLLGSTISQRKARSGWYHLLAQTHPFSATKS